MQQRGIPEFNVAMRGLCYFHVEVRTGRRDLHSGMYGSGAERDACVAAGARGRDAARRSPSRAAARRCRPADRRRALRLTGAQPGAEALEEQGAVPTDGRAAEDFYLRTWAEPSVDVHGIAGGSPRLIKTVLPVHAEANASIRLVLDQDPAAIAVTFERLLRAAPAGAELEVTVQSKNPPALIRPDAPAVVIGLDAFEHVVGRRPLLVRPAAPSRSWLP